MAWRGSTSVQDRVFACLPYAFPMVESMMFGTFLMQQFPTLGLILLPLTPFAAIYGILNSLLGGWGGFAIFFALYLLIVRNESLSHFLRFNTMQALIIGIAVSLISAVLDLLGLLRNLALPLPLPIVVIFSTIFLGVLISSIYSIIQAIRGRYAEIPVLSEAAYSQVRY
jgi:uncharacterized membrane protein